MGLHLTAFLGVGALYIFSHSGVRRALAAHGEALAEASDIALAEVEPLGSASS